jgi:hypothetical protein
MRARRLRWGAIAWLALGLAAVAPVGAAPGSLSVPQYISELDALRSRFNSDDDLAAQRALVDSLPPVWSVNGSTRTFQIQTGSLRRDMRSWAFDHDESARRRFLDNLQTLRTDAAAFERRVPARSRERARLSSILAAPEFRDVHGPTWIDRLWQRVLYFVAHYLWAGLASSAMPTIGNVIVYGLVAAAVFVLALSAHRYRRRRVAIETVAFREASTRAHDWSLWLTEAYTAAGRADWRRAIHLAYWCSVTFLEAKGAWRPDYARTPREYLRLLAPSSDDHAALAALTRRFERVWYGMAEADADTFAESVEDLKKIGCSAV